MVSTVTSMLIPMLILILMGLICVATNSTEKAVVKAATEGTGGGKKGRFLAINSVRHTNAGCGESDRLVGG